MDSKLAAVSRICWLTLWTLAVVIPLQLATIDFVNEWYTAHIYGQYTVLMCSVEFRLFFIIISGIISRAVGTAVVTMVQTIALLFPQFTTSSS